MPIWHWLKWGSLICICQYSMTKKGLNINIKWAKGRGKWYRGCCAGLKTWRPGHSRGWLRGRWGSAAGWLRSRCRPPGDRRGWTRWTPACPCRPYRCAPLAAVSAVPLGSGPLLLTHACTGACSPTHIHMCIQACIHTHIEQEREHLHIKHFTKMFSNVRI